MCGYILSQHLVAFSNIKTAHLKKLTEYVNLFQDALLRSDLPDTQISEFLNLFHKFFIDFDRENLQPALGAVSKSELNEEQQQSIHTMVYILDRLHKDINLMQKLLNKCHTLINAKIETQLPFISQLQSKH